MSNKIEEMQARLKEMGYFASPNLSKLVLLFEAAGKRERRSIPTLLLQGKSGAGKTFLAETFSKMIGADEKFVQCFPRMGTENFQYDVNIEGVMKQDADNSIKEGILLQALQQSKISPVVLIIDELDKARPEVDSFLLDFLENGRLTTGTDIYEKGDFPIYTFITSNDKREIDEALLNRSKRVEVPRPDKDLFLEILGLPENHYLGYVYDKCPNFSIRQARQYIEDLEVLGTEIDEEALSQYINLDELDVMSLADIQHLAEMETEGLEFELPDLERCRRAITSGDEISSWRKMLENGNPYKFRLYADEENDGKIYADIDTVEQLQEVCKHIDFDDEDDYEKRYEGWFECSLSSEEMQSGNIIWADNKDQKSGTRFGVKIEGENMFRIAMNRGMTFVYLDSRESTLEQFLANRTSEMEQEYETDKEYNNDGIDLDD